MAKLRYPPFLLSQESTGATHYKTNRAWFPGKHPSTKRASACAFWCWELTYAIVRAYNPDFQQNFNAGKKRQSRQKTANPRGVYCRNARG